MLKGKRFSPGSVYYRPPPAFSLWFMDQEEGNSRAKNSRFSGQNGLTVRIGRPASRRAIALPSLAFPRGIRIPGPPGQTVSSGTANRS